MARRDRSAEEAIISLPSSFILCNVGFFTTKFGIVSLLQIALGSICLTLVAYYTNKYQPQVLDPDEQFFYIVAFAFLLGTVVRILSSAASIYTSLVLPKTLHDVLYNCFATILYLTSSLTLIIRASNNKTEAELAEQYIQVKRYKAMTAAGVLGLINSTLYAASLFQAAICYRKNQQAKVTMKKREYGQFFSVRQPSYTNDIFETNQSNYQSFNVPPDMAAQMTDNANKNWPYPHYQEHLKKKKKPFHKKIYRKIRKLGKYKMKRNTIATEV